MLRPVTVRAIRIAVEVKVHEDKDLAQRIADVRAKVPESHRAEFDELLAEARLLYRLRDDIADAVAQTLSKNFPAPVEYVGTLDTFGESGTPEDLMKKYHLDTPDILAAVEKVLARKTK